MTEKEFLNTMEDILDIQDTLQMDTILEDMEEWDSLSTIMFQSYATEKLHKPVVPAALKSAKTVRDLYEMVK